MPHRPQHSINRVIIKNCLLGVALSHFQHYRLQCHPSEKLQSLERNCLLQAKIGKKRLGEKKRSSHDKWVKSMTLIRGGSWLFTGNYSDLSDLSEETHQSLYIWEQTFIWWSTHKHLPIIVYQMSPSYQSENTLLQRMQSHSSAHILYKLKIFSFHWCRPDVLAITCITISLT